MNGNYIALIPAYKPGPFLLELAQKLWNNGFHIVIVDDGSGPQYEKLFWSEANAKACSFQIAGGKRR